MLNRPALELEVRAALKRSPAVALIGPRQVGKTTLARSLLGPQSSNYFDLEDPQIEAQLAAPMTALKDLQGLVVIDEVQHAPELFKVLRVLIDRPEGGARFLLLGSASPALLRQTGESLAGRIEVIETGGFTLDETGVENAARLWWRGGFPRSYTASDDTASRVWRREFIRTVVQRDLPQLGIGAPAPAIYRFWSMLARYHGQIWNAADPARSLGVNESTVRRCGVKRDRYRATPTPTSVDSVAATSVSAALPPSAVQNPEVPKTRANAAPPSRNASTATATTGSAKKSASSSTPGDASTNRMRVRIANGRHSRGSGNPVSFVQTPLGPRFRGDDE